jgi:DNA-binding MarR family transcriptional regulator
MTALPTYPTSSFDEGGSPIGPPLLGALLRIPVDVIRRRMIEALHERGFTDLLPAHLIVLRYPGPDGRRPIEIAAGSGMSKQAINYHLGQLEMLRYLDRHDDPDDQRSKRVYLTARGRAAIGTMRQAVSDVEQEWAQELGADELDQLRTILTHLATVITRA